MTGFYLQIADFFLKIDSKVAFGVGLSACVVAFVINLVMVITLKEYVLKKRVWVIFIYSACLCTQIACDLLKSPWQPLSLYVFSVLLLLSIPSFLIPSRQRVISENQLDFVRFMDSRLYGSESAIKPSDCDAEDLVIPSPSPVRQAVGTCGRAKRQSDSTKRQDLIDDSATTGETLNFSHVKHVISRLDAFGLTASDKKQVKELQTAIARVENGENLPDVKRSVNDGLGALLKIMSKYGV